MNIREQLQTLRTTLLVPAAEYVPAISDALDQIDQMLADEPPPAPAGRTLTEAVIWGEARELQIDSFATNRPQAGMAHLMGDYIHVEVTDGRESWAGKIPLPKGWKP